MKLTGFFRKTLKAALLVVLMAGCNKEPCLDMPLIERLSQELQTWYVTDTASMVFLITDSHGISQSLVADKPWRHVMEGHVTDDCGQQSPSYNFSMQYTTSVSPLHFMVDIRGAAPGYGGYVIEISWMRTLDNWGGQKAIYDLETGRSKSDEAQCQVVSHFECAGLTYPTVLQVEYNGLDFPSAVSKLWFAKEIGIVAYEDGSGNRYERQPAGT